MWLFASTGFYSAVVDAQDPEVIVVRARVREDLEALIKAQYLTDASEIHDGLGTDYPFRVFTTRAAWAKAVSNLALELDCANFKQSVGERFGPERERLYHRVWATMLCLRKEPARPISCSASAGAGSGSRTATPPPSVPSPRCPRRGRRP